MKMNLTKIILSAFLLASLTVGELAGQEFTKTGTAAAQFLKIPVGAKAIAMGSTFTSMADDISALYWNPAGSASFERFELGLTRMEWIAGVTYNYFGLVLPTGDAGTFGLFVSQLSSGDIEVTTIDAPKGTGTFYEAADIAVGVTYARDIMEKVSAGVAVKYVSQRIANTSAQSVAFDVGVLLRTGFHGMKLGLAFQNFGPTLQMSGTDLIKPVDLDIASEINPVVEASLSTQSYALPGSYRASVSMPLVGPGGVLESGRSTFIAGIDAIHHLDSKEHYSIGGEYGFSQTLFLRAGYLFNRDQEGLTAGGGVKLGTGASAFTFDYAYAEFGGFSAIHVFSVGVRL